MIPCAVCALACSGAGGEQTQSPKVATAPGPDPAPKPVPTPEPVAAPEPAPAPQGPPITPEDCEDADPCFQQGRALARAGKRGAAVPWLEEACGLGSGAACMQLGSWYRDGKGVRADDERARELFEEGCANGDERACDAVGH